MKVKWIVGIVLGTSAMGFSQVKPPTPDPINTDRPDFTDSPLVVPFHSVQIESGLLYQWDRPTYSLSGPELLFRIGVGPRTEIRVGLPDENWQHINSVASTGIGDGSIGAKFQFRTLSHGDHLGLVLAATLPSRRHDFSTGTVDPLFELCFNRDLGHAWDVSAMVYGLYTSDEVGRQSVYRQTVSFGHDLNEHLNLFLEYAETYPQRETPDRLAHAGIALRPKPDTQYDVHAGYSLVGSDHKPFLGAGYSRRF